LLSYHFGVEFKLNDPIQRIAMGYPPKEHQFDLVSTDLCYIGECKNYSWTISGNVPSAKMAFINEAVLHLSLLPSEKLRFIAMRRDIHPESGESLADYYYRTNRYLLNGVFIVEIDTKDGRIREIGRRPNHFQRAPKN
jgi:hypothetical protein